MTKAPGLGGQEHRRAHAVFHLADSLQRLTVTQIHGFRVLLDHLRHHGRNREGGADGVDGDLGAQLGGQGAGQHTRRLGGTVAHVAAAAAEGPDAPGRRRG